MSKTIVVRFEMPLSPRVRVFGLAALLISGLSAEVASESVSLTTYYPAPSGVYTQLIATSNSFMARDSGYLDVGTNVTPPSIPGGPPSVPPGVTNVKEYVQNGSVLIAQPYQLAFGNSSVLTPDQGGAIELGGNNLVAGTGTPYIDFHLVGVPVQDFNARLINQSNGTLTTMGNSQVSGAGSQGRGYIYIDNSNTACGLVSYVGDSGAGTTICSAGEYATYTPGVYVESWSYQNLGSQSYALTSGGAVTFTVCGPSPGVATDNCGDPLTLEIDHGNGQAYCCPK